MYLSVCATMHIFICSDCMYPCVCDCVEVLVYPKKEVSGIPKKGRNQTSLPQHFISFDLYIDNIKGTGTLAAGVRVIAHTVTYILIQHQPR